MSTLAELVEWFVALNRCGGMLHLNFCNQQTLGKHLVEMLQCWRSWTNGSAFMLHCGKGCLRRARGRTSTPQHHIAVAVKLTQTQIGLPLGPAAACPQGAANSAKCWQSRILNHIKAFDLKAAGVVDQHHSGSDVDHHMNGDWLLKRARGAYVVGDMHGEVAWWSCRYKSPTLLEPDMSGRICASRRPSRISWPIGWLRGDEGLSRFAADMG